MTKSTDAAGNHTFVMNIEGTVTGGMAGAALGTITATTADFADGSVVTGMGSGVFGLSGTHNWQLNGTATLSNGARVATEGVLDLASRSYNGKMLEIS